jgi:hypothetical protein
MNTVALITSLQDALPWLALIVNALIAPAVWRMVASLSDLRERTARIEQQLSSWAVTHSRIEGQIDDLRNRVAAVELAIARNEQRS